MTVLTLAAASMMSGKAGVVEITSGTPTYNGQGFRVFYAPSISWNDAQAYVASNLGAGWHLATATSEGANNFLWQTIQAADPKPGDPARQYWLGGYQSSPGNFQWVTGEAITYQPWAAGEPNGDDNWTGHVSIGRFDTAQWNDEGSWPSGIRGFVASTPEPSTYAAIFGLGCVAWAGYRRSKN